MKKLLIVDDDSDILEALRLTFEAVKFEVKTSDKGNLAYSLAKKYKPDLILLDILLSGVDGRDICKNLKAAKETKKIPVLMISAQPDVEKSALEAGANKFLAKPFDIEKLVRTVKKLSN